MVTQEADDLNNEINNSENKETVIDNTDVVLENEEGDEIVITIDGESPTPDEEHDDTKAPDWVKELRKNHRELVKKNRELEEELTKVKPKEPELTLSPKPTLADCDYDADEFEAKLEKWHEEKLQYDAKQREAEDKRKAETEAWQSKLNGYMQAKTELKVKDFNDVETLVKSHFSVTQQGIIIDAATDPAVMIYAIGKNPKLLKELSEIKNPAQFSFALGKLEGKLKVTERKAPPPMRSVEGSGSAGSAIDSTLEKLRKEAEQTGNYSKVVAYKNELKRKTNT